MPRRPSIVTALVTAVLALVCSVALGLSSGVATAADYPLPTTGDGQVDATLVAAGDCVTFSGGGFLRGSTVTVRDNGSGVGTAQVDQSGRFSFVVCFGTNAALGRHTLTGSGTGANGAARVVSAVVTVHGVTTTQPVAGAGGGNGSGGGGGGGLPFTGSDVRDLSLFGAGLVLLGFLLVRRGKEQRRARRALRQTAA